MNKLTTFSRAILAIAIMLCVALPTLAHDFEVDGIYYNYLDKTAKTVEVTYGGSYSSDYSNEYTGSVIIPSSVTYNGTTYSVTSIGNYVFYGCSGLTSITIPNSVTSIGFSAFDYCTGLTSITIPNSVTSINSSAFCGCISLTEVNISDLSAWCKIYFGSDDANPLSYAEKFKLNGAEIKDLVIPNDITKIKDYAFYGCSGLTSVTIPNSVTSIGKAAFKDCRGLTSITIPNSVTSIGESAFRSCSGLTSITIPNSVTSIGSYAFDGTGWYYNQPNGILYLDNCCLGYKGDKPTGSLSLKEGTRLIGSEAFKNCTGLTSITIPNSVTSIGSSAFDWTGWYYHQPNGILYLDNCCLGYNGDEPTGSLSLKEGTRLIGSYAFEGCTGLTSITIPNSVTSIGDGAFWFCSGLTEVNISDLSAWCKIDFGDSDANPLYYAKKFKLNGAEIKDLVIPNDITKIKDYAFYSCSGLTSITIPNSVTSIGDGAFSGCYGLTSVNYNAENCTSMGSSSFPVFSGCSILKTLNIGNKVKTIPYYAFSSCTGLTSITIPNSVTSIGNYAFGNCTGLTKLILEDGTESISGLSFPSSPIETLYLGRNTSDTFVKGKTTLKEVAIGNSVTSIGNSAFEGCTSLTSITIPNSITSISERAFSGCTGLTSVIIGDSVSSIGASAFYGCSNLIESNNVISPTSVKVNLNTLCPSNLVPCIAINNKYYTNNTLVESLDPEYSYNYDLGLKFKDNFILIGSSSFLTGELELMTQAAKATSSSSVRLIATTNCDATAGTGFEWLRYDAPAELPPNKVSCPIVDGMLIGSLRGVRDDAYYKYRPFYTSASGKTYYGEWIAFFTGDANVYFEPEVQTYSDYAITDNSVVVKGYALEGTDEITAQGFEYWKTGSTILPSSTENRMTVMASGIKMSATLANLEYNSTYKYRAFVTTAKDTIYGNEVEFETGEDPVGVESILIDKSATEVFEIARYDIHGRLLSKPSRGINIIIYSDGSTRKEIIK